MLLAEEECIKEAIDVINETILLKSLKYKKIGDKWIRPDDLAKKGKNIGIT